MTATRDLRRLHKAAVSRLKTIRSIAGLIRPPVTTENDRLLAWCVIESLTLWQNFSRSYFLSIAMRARRGSGGKIICARSLRTQEQALRFAIMQTKTPNFRSRVITHRDEPTWHDRTILLRAIAAIGPSNIATIQVALSHRSHYFKHLATIRNFYAHRTASTNVKARETIRRIGLNPLLRTSDALCTPFPRRPQQALVDWLDDMSLVIDTLCN